MKRIYSKLTFALIAMLCALSTGANAQTWDFSEEGIGVIDGDNLSADTKNWEYESANDRYKNTATYLPASELLKANGQELNFTNGLFFDVIAADGVRLDNKKKCLTLNKATTVITIKNAKKGFKLTIECQGSSKTEARGLNVTNITPESGYFNSTSRDLQTNVGTVIEDGDITIHSTGGMYVYKISLVDPAEEEQGGTVPSTDNSVGLNVNKNQVLLTTTGNVMKYYNTDDISGISIDKSAGTVTVNSASFAAPDVFTKSISNISFAKKAETGSEGDINNQDGLVEITEAKGWQESAYVKWKAFDGAYSYNVYVSGNDKPIDGQLVREYKNYFRADVVGLKAGSYSLKIVPVKEDGTEMTEAANTAENLTVKNYLREGFAFKDLKSSGVGAYNNDGSLKEGAIVLYVTKDNFNTITCDILVGKNTETRTGLGNILAGLEKGTETRPIAVRFIGDVSGVGTSQLSGEKHSLQIKGKGETSDVQVTLEGIGDDATLDGFGITLAKVAGVEIRNLGVMKFEDDGIQLKDGSHVWVHNNDIFYGQVGGDADQAKGDGSLDTKDSGSNNTFSFNHFWDSGKMSLCGMKGENTDDVETYHHNWFDHSDSRHPRVRTKTVHVYNNYYDGVSKYGVGATMGSSVFVENNYFRHTKSPMLISKQGTDAKGGGTFSGENGGMIKSYGNVYAEKGSSSNYTPITQNESATAFDCYEASSRDEQVPSQYKALVGGTSYNNFDTNDLYDYTPDAAENVPAVVTGYYGAGRLNHGDFTWTFNNSVDDTSYDVNKELKDKIVNYKNTEFVRVLGDLGTSSGETGDGGGSTGGGETGGETGGGETTTPIEGTVICYFKDKAPSNSAFKVVGNTSTSKGSVTVDGVTYTECLKMESSTSVAFTTTQKMTLKLYFGSDTNGKKVKVDGEKIAADSENIVDIVIEAGDHSLEKADSINLFLIKLVPVTE